MTSVNILHAILKLIPPTREEWGDEGQIESSPFFARIVPLFSLVSLRSCRAIHSWRDPKELRALGS